MAVSEYLQKEFEIRREISGLEWVLSSKKIELHQLQNKIDTLEQDMFNDTIEQRKAAAQQLQTELTAVETQIRDMEEAIRQKNALINALENEMGTPGETIQESDDEQNPGISTPDYLDQFDALRQVMLNLEIQITAEEQQLQQLNEQIRQLQNSRDVASAEQNAALRRLVDAREAQSLTLQDLNLQYTAKKHQLAALEKQR
jgi:chromosome segregation ATPase